MDVLSAPKIVTMARSVEKLHAMRERFGNMPEEKLLIVNGNLGELLMIPL